MDALISSLISQWPSLTGIIVLGLAFWKMFNRHLEENKVLLSEGRVLTEEYRSLSVNKANEMQALIAEYKNLSAHKVEEIDRLRKMFLAVVEENQQYGKRYDELRGEFTKLLLENRALKRTIDSIEEMLRATGGDVKVIATQLQKTKEEIEDVSNKIQRLEYNPPSHNA